MPSTEVLLTFLIATAVFAYMPGPSMLYAAAQTIARGRRAGWLAALGIHVGGYAHVIAAALGLSVLFTAVPILYSISLPLWGQLMILGTFVNVAFSSADVLCVLLSSTVVKFFKQSPTGSRIVQRIGGGVLVALGINLAISRQ